MNSENKICHDILFISKFILILNKLYLLTSFMILYKYFVRYEDDFSSRLALMLMF